MLARVLSSAHFVPTYVFPLLPPSSPSLLLKRRERWLHPLSQLLRRLSIVLLADSTASEPPSTPPWRKGTSEQLPEEMTGTARTERKAVTGPVWRSRARKRHHNGPLSDYCMPRATLGLSICHHLLGPHSSSVLKCKPISSTVHQG